MKPKCIFGLERWIAGAYHLSHVELKWHCWWWWISWWRWIMNGKSANDETLVRWNHDDEDHDEKLSLSYMSWRRLNMPAPKRNAGGCWSFSLRGVPGTFDMGETSKGICWFAPVPVGKPEGARFRIPRHRDWEALCICTSGKSNLWASRSLGHPGTGMVHEVACHNSGEQKSWMGCFFLQTLPRLPS